MRKHVIAAMAVGVCVLPWVASASAQADELAELKAQLAVLQAKVEELEKRQQSQQEAQDRTTDVLAQTRSNVGDWVSRFEWKGDLRYRVESFDVETVEVDRTRERLRARAGFTAKINDAWRAEVLLATGADDPRSANQTLSDEASRKDFGLDLAYAQWKPNDRWRLTVGKMKQQWVRPGLSGFIDADVNPEGGALNFTSAAGFFAGAFYHQVEERSSLAESTLAAAQAGWRGEVGGAKLMLGAGYYDYGAVEGFDPFFNGPNGNTVVARNSSNPAEAALAEAICRGTVASVPVCLVNDYDIVQAFAEVGLSAGGRQLTLYVDYARNTAADDLDTAYGIGAVYGKVSGPRSWELGYLYQDVEKDAVFGQWVDSDFGDGNTDTRGSVFRFGYGVARNFNFNATYFLNDLNVSGLSAGLQGRDYERMQLDLNYRF